MSEDRRPNDKCPSVPYTDNGTPGHAPAPVGQRWDNGGQVNLKSLAAKVLSQTGQRDKRGTSVGQSCPTAPQSCPTQIDTEIEATDDPLFDSMKRLEALSISIGVLDDGTMHVVQTNDEAADAIERGFSIYSPRDMYYYVQLPPHERILLHNMKRRFGGTIQWTEHGGAADPPLGGFRGSVRSPARKNETEEQMIDQQGEKQND